MQGDALRAGLNDLEDNLEGNDPQRLLDDDLIIKEFPGAKLSYGESLARHAAEANAVTLLHWKEQTENPQHQTIINNELLRRQLGKLIKSSRNVEGLTETLITLTKWLVGLTVVLALLTLMLALDVGNKFRQEYFSEVPQPSVQQTPTRPPR